MCSLFQTPMRLVLMICLLAVSCKKEERQNSTTNDPPIARAGDDVTLYVPETTVNLDARLSYDPNDYIYSYEWKKIEGPELYYRLVNGRQLRLHSLVEGIYAFELQVKDSWGITAKDTVQVTVIDEFAIGKTPIVELPCDTRLVAVTENSVWLLAKAYVEDQGQRYVLNEGFSYSQISGPTNATIAEIWRDGEYAVTHLSNLARGTYKLKVEVMRKGVAAYDTATVQVIDDTLVGKEYIFETTWKGTASFLFMEVASIEISGRPDLFYFKNTRDMQVSLKLPDQDWQDIYDEIFQGSGFYYVMDNRCGQSFKVYAIGDDDLELIDQSVMLRIRYLQ
jgi:hypothetical protein